MEVVVVLVVMAIAVALIAAPLRHGRAAADEAAESAERADLDAAKEAKYREIREAELDYRTGKLSHEDWRALDAGLRAEAVDLLRRLDALGVPDREP
jgi:type II secretory pathway pseudopilin PulG